MRAMILCAGLGTRLQKYTQQMPKPMLEVHGKPVLEYTILHLAFLGIIDIVINLHYLPHKITSYFKNGAKWGVNITYIHEGEILGTAGAVKNAERLLKDSQDFLLLYGDVLCNQDYRELICFHRSKQESVASIILHKRNRSNSIVDMDESNKIIRFNERPEETNARERKYWVNSGLYCLQKTIFNYIPKNVVVDFPRDVFPTLIQSGKLFGQPLNGYRCAIDSPQRYAKAQRDLAKKKIFTIQDE